MNLFPCPLRVDNSVNYEKRDPGGTLVNFPCVAGRKPMKLVVFGRCGISMSGEDGFSGLLSALLFYSPLVVMQRQIKT